jgi:hypothetical protein
VCGEIFNQLAQIIPLRLEHFDLGAECGTVSLPTSERLLVLIVVALTRRRGRFDLGFQALDLGGGFTAFVNTLSTAVGPLPVAKSFC